MDGLGEGERGSSTSGCNVEEEVLEECVEDEAIGAPDSKVEVAVSSGAGGTEAVVLKLKNCDRGLDRRLADLLRCKEGFASDADADSC